MLRVITYAGRHCSQTRTHIPDDDELGDAAAAAADVLIPSFPGAVAAAAAADALVLL